MPEKYNRISNPVLLYHNTAKIATRMQKNAIAALSMFRHEDAERQTKRREQQHRDCREKAANLRETLFFALPAISDQ